MIFDGLALVLCGFVFLVILGLMEERDYRRRRRWQSHKEFEELTAKRGDVSEKDPK